MYEGTSVLMSRRPAGRYKRRLGPAREGLDFGLSVSAVGKKIRKSRCHKNRFRVVSRMIAC